MCSTNRITQHHSPRKWWWTSCWAKKMTDPPCKARRCKVCLTHCSYGMSGASAWNKQIQWSCEVVVQGNSLDNGEICREHIRTVCISRDTVSERWRIHNKLHRFHQYITSESKQQSQPENTGWGWAGRECWASTADSGGHVALTHNFYWVDYISLPVSACLSCSLSRTWPISFCK